MMTEEELIKCEENEHGDFFEFYTCCDHCDELGMLDADGWRYNTKTGLLLCEGCYDECAETYDEE